ncbi:TRAP transporter large permease subunit, partial [Bacillus sp. NTK071]
GLTSGLFKAMRILLRKLPGGLACSTVGASALFAAASGSSVATAAAMSRIAVPEMVRAGYDKALATGSVAASGTLGSLIPPSILMILFG